MADAAALDPELAGWIGDATGGSIVDADRLPGGNRHQAWRVDVRMAGGDIAELFLRCDGADATSGDDPFTIRREAAIYLALAGTGVPVPGLVAVHPVRQAMLTERVGGQSAYHSIGDDETRRAVATDLMRAVAALHRLDPGRLDLAPLGPVTTVSEHIRGEIALWEGLYRKTGRVDPLIEFGLRWLARNVPSGDAPVVVVHGDTGPGNFLFSGPRVTALIDWELVHLGDAMEDLAWLSMRSIFEPVPDFPGRLADYERFAGRPVDVDRIRYHRVLVQWRVAIIRHRDTGDRRSGSDPANSLTSWAVNRRLFVEALADAAGSALEPVDVEPGPETSLSWLYGAVLDQLREIIVPRTSDPLAKTKAKGVARVIKYLEACERNGAAFAAAELDDLTALLGAAPGSVPAGREALSERIRLGALDGDAVLRYLHRQCARDTALMRPALGALADRHLPDLDDRSRRRVLAGSGGDSPA